MASEPIERLIEMGSGLLHPGLSPLELRAVIAEITAARPDVPGCVVVPEEGDGVSGEWIRQADVSPDAEGIVCWFHGGGYCGGEPAMMRGIGTFLSRATGTRMFAPRYRLAPEHPHPAALEDALAAYRWLVARGHEPKRIVVGGDSAGGGLVLAMLLALRDAGDALPAGSVTFSPWTDHTITAESFETRSAYTFGLSEDLMRKVSAAYRAGRDPREPAVSPLFGDWTGMPPMHVQVGDHEVLLSDATELVKRAKAAGVETEVVVWPEMPHVHQVFVGTAPESDEACLRAAEFIRSLVRT